ncbi:Ferrochelatase [Candidatus Nitrosacidococcus tergens]|uniref:Ferrochelatase n=1 Tax=Candidatus Nitrosacidococcus tergens TaxID=553981 RepID=A0A7G1QAF1_9GAMM|nr:Ferrochelatase [Candidatus Nitrosacidococcus tergens]
MGFKEYDHPFQNQTTHVGILLTSLGTPNTPTPSGVRQFLREFLSDPKVIEMPRLLWLPILYGFILPIRPYYVARLYQSIWREDDSPLRSFANKVGNSLQKELNHRGQSVKVVLGMRYGFPSIAQALEELHQLHIKRLIILPLYPQYSGSTTGSTFDAIAKTISKWRWLPELHMIMHYHNDHGYLDALTENVKATWEKRGRGERLLISFHGLPNRYFLAGDPYYHQCCETAQLLADRLQLKQEDWQIAFQSRFGREEWLKPYADHLLVEWAKAGVKYIDVVCPGFVIDCLETLEEMAERNKKLFLQAGGESYHYIPALNDKKSHIFSLANLVEQHI